MNKNAGFSLTPGECFQAHVPGCSDLALMDLRGSPGDGGTAGGDQQHGAGFARPRRSLPHSPGRPSYGMALDSWPLVLKLLGDSEGRSDSLRKRLADSLRMLF